jgi:hypothetical protein
MSDYYGVNWGSGPGSESYPPQPWAFGDQGPADVVMYQAFQEADVIWRDMEARRLAAFQRQQSAEPYTVPPAVTRPTEWIAVSPQSEPLRPQPAARPGHTIPSAPPARSYRPPQESPAHITDRERARRWGFGVAAATAVALGMRALWPSAEAVPVESTETASYSVPANFACDVVGIDERDGVGVLYMRSAVDPRAQVNVHGDTQASRAVSDTATISKLTYPLDGMHDQQLHVQVQGVNCRGVFTLGKPGTGDESFQ